MIILRTVRDVEDLLENKPIGPLFSKEMIRFEIPGMSEKENDSWQVRLNAYKNDCGCSTGAAFCCIALIVVIVLVCITAFSSPITSTLKVVAFGMVAIFLIGLVGKMLGLFIARLRFKRGCAKLLEQLKQHNAARLHEIGGPDVEMHAVGR